MHYVEILDPDRLSATLAAMPHRDTEKILRFHTQEERAVAMAAEFARFAKIKAARAARKDNEWLL